MHDYGCAILFWLFTLRSVHPHLYFVVTKYFLFNCFLSLNFVFQKWAINKLETLALEASLFLWCCILWVLAVGIHLQWRHIVSTRCSRCIIRLESMKHFVLVFPLESKHFVNRVMDHQLTVISKTSVWISF